MIHVLKCLFKETTELLDEYHEEDLLSPKSNGKINIANV